MEEVAGFRQEGSEPSSPIKTVFFFFFLAEELLVSQEGFCCLHLGYAY